MCIDESFETALIQNGKRPIKIIDDIDIAYGIQPPAVPVLKLQGCISRPDSLILTDDDLIEHRRHISRLIDQARLSILLSPIIIVGARPPSRLVRELHSEASAGLGQHMRRALFFWERPSPQDVSYWTRRQVRVIDASTSDIVDVLSGSLHNRQPAERGDTESVARQTYPYKGLAQYTVDDRDIFCGRDNEISIVVRLLLRTALPCCSARRERVSRHCFRLGSYLLFGQKATRQFTFD